MKDNLKKAERTEEVQEIIERMPSSFGIKITSFVLSIVIVFFSLGWVIKYPDVVTGRIVINTSNAPIKLVANFSGKLKLLDYSDNAFIKEGSYIALLQNSADHKDVQKISALISKMDIKGGHDLKMQVAFPKNVSLGELNITYYKFLNAYNQITNYNKENIFDKELDILTKLIKEYQSILNITSQRLKMSSKGLEYYKKIHQRDSILLSKKVLSEGENDRSELTFISANDAFQIMLKEISTTRSQLEQTQNQLQRTQLQKFEKEKQLELDMITSFVDLGDNIKDWEQKYVFKAPYDGKIQFSKFWTDNQYILSGEPVFTIVPDKSKVIGQMNLPAIGAGKVKNGQNVIIKLEDYPYIEYGSIQGVVSSISLTTNPVRTEKGDIETYLVNIDLPNKLITNYGSELNFKFEIKGNGDIITNDRRLIERLFDNLNYKLRE